MIKSKDIFWILIFSFFSCNSQEKSREFNPNVFGFCTSNSFTYCDVNDTSFANKVLKINPQVLRFPGGSLGNFYHYNGSGYGFDFEEIQECHSQKFADRVSGLLRTQQKKGHSQNYIDDFIDISIQNNSKVVLVANILTSSDSEIIQIINRFKYENIEILGVELGSELSNRAYKKHINSVEDYIQMAKKYSKIIKKEFPNIKVGVVTSTIKEDIPSRLLNWNMELAKETFYDAIIHHSYFKVVDGEEDAGVMISEKEVKESKKIQFELYKNRIVNYFTKGFINEIEKYNQIFNNKDIWITEWNLQMTKTTGNTLLQSLFVSQYYLELFSNPDLKNIKISTYHNLAGRDVSGSIFKGSNNSFETHSTYYPLTFLGKIFENDIVRIEKELYDEVFIYKCYDSNGKNKISFEIDWEEKTFSYNYFVDSKGDIIDVIQYKSKYLFDKPDINGILKLDSSSIIVD